MERILERQLLRRVLVIVLAALALLVVVWLLVFGIGLNDGGAGVTTG